jgi:hypothetical protein
MRFEIGAMSVGDILDRGLKIFLSRLPTFFFINFLVLSPLMALQLVQPIVLMNAQSSSPSVGIVVGFLVFTLGVMFLTMILGPIGAAASLHVIGQEFIDQRVGIGEAFSFALSRFGSLFLVSLLSGLVYLAGMCLFCIPMFLFMVWFAFGAQIVVMENRGPIEAMNRSKELGTGFGWRILGILLLLIVIQIIITLVSAGFNALFPGMEQVVSNGVPVMVLRSYPLHVADVLVNFMLSVVSQAYAAICITLTYFDLRIRKEGFDLEMAARGHSSEPGEKDLS